MRSRASKDSGEKAAYTIINFLPHRPFWKVCRLFTAQHVLKQGDGVLEIAQA